MHCDDVILRVFVIMGGTRDPCHPERNMVVGEAEDHVKSKDPYSLFN
ncbi:MAG: hypothetical protein WB817_10255 [Terriglobales bacterium]